MLWLTVTVDRTTLFLVLGGLPVAMWLVPRSWAPSIESRPVAVVAGVVCTAAQLVAGAAGALVDLFFVKSSLTRFEIIATKAVLSATGHLIKLVYFVALVPEDAAALPLWVYPAVVAMAMIGTRVGKRILHRLSDARFRAWSSVLILAISFTLLARGAAGLLVQ